MSKSKILAASESNKSGTKRPAVNRSVGSVPAAKKQAPNICETEAKKSTASGLNKSGAKAFIAGGPDKPRIGEYLVN